MAERVWVPNSFPNSYLNSELKLDQLILNLENEFLKWFSDLNQIATPHFYFNSHPKHTPLSS
jgi:hypothetical protein